MNELQIFKSEEFGEVRTVTINNAPWFVGKDVAMALGYSNTKDALKTHVTEEDKRILQRSKIATNRKSLAERSVSCQLCERRYSKQGINYYQRIWIICAYLWK